ncbi:MAG: phosphatidylserine decarboxylase [Chlamydiales bacterium]|nr:phosphatidylserine decarboxylase [Chlamydiales bacterium]
MNKIYYINRRTEQIEKEEVYGGALLTFIYGSSLLNKTLGKCLQVLFSCSAVFSRFYGYLQKLPLSKKKIIPFIKKFHVNESEFQDPLSSFSCFNDFFIRKLKKNARPIDSRSNSIIIPADGRYLIYPDIQEANGFVIKEKKFDLKKLINDDLLTEKYSDGSMVIARLCPSDYHRFHFPLDAFAKETHLINGYLYSVNPIALRANLNIFVENKRAYTLLETKHSGTILFMEVGATNVGSIHQTYVSNTYVKKGEEKGYFSFGGSTLVLLFEKNKIQFDKDLLKASETHIEVLCKMGESMGIEFE